MPDSRIATLLTDFGTRDPYVAAMKGVILRNCPEARIIDLCHDVDAHDVLAASLALDQAAPLFPAGTVHVVVVDPGVGTERDILAAQFADQIYVFPDNGVITHVAQSHPMQALASIGRGPSRPAGEVSQTFHGRDIFAPIAAQLLNGARIAQFGPQPTTYKMLDLPQPRAAADVVVGQVIYVDRFGNLVSNIPGTMVRRRWGSPDDVRVSCGGVSAGPLASTYGLVAPQAPVALINSMGLVEVAVNQGRACDVLKAGIGAEVSVSGREDRS